MRAMSALAALVLAACAPLQASDPASPVTEAGTVDHVVIVWLKPEYRNDEGRAALKECGQMLRTIPGLLSLSIGTAVLSDRPIVDDSFDVAFHFKFASIPAMQTYVSHPTHLEFLKKCTSESVERNLIYDSAG